jgi:hypothetical protein
MALAGGIGSDTYRFSLFDDSSSASEASFLSDRNPPLYLSGNRDFAGFHHQWKSFVAGANRRVGAHSFINPWHDVGLDVAHVGIRSTCRAAEPVVP